MLSIESAKEIGINACIDKLRRDFVLAHRDSAASAYGENDGSVFCFVGVDDRCSRPMPAGTLILDSRSSFSYRASCNVDLTDGKPTFIECIRPD